MATGCAGRGAEPVAASPSETGARPPRTFAIYEVDDLHDLTTGVTALPEWIEVFHEKEEPKAGYFYAYLPGESQATMLDRLKVWSATLQVPPGDALLFGANTTLGVRTYLVKDGAILDAFGVAGAMAVAVSGDGWGVALTFKPEALQSLSVALSKPGTHFRVVVQGLVDKGPFELLDERSSEALAGPHGGLSTTNWICADHRALMTLSARGGVSTKARAESLAAALPPFRDARECRTERTVPRPTTAPKAR